MGPGFFFSPGWASEALPAKARPVMRTRPALAGARRSVGDEFDMVFMRREWPVMPPTGRHVRPWLPPESRAARDRQAEDRQAGPQAVEAHERVPEPARPEGQAQGPARILGGHLQRAAGRDRENRPQEPRRPGRRPRTHHPRGIRRQLEADKADHTAADRKAKTE